MHPHSLPWSTVLPLSDNRDADLVIHRLARWIACLTARRILCALPALLMLLAGSPAQGQGKVLFANTSSTLVYTNALAIGGTRGLTAPIPGLYIYALFTAPSTVTTATAQDLISGAWQFTGAYATNTAQAGRFSGSSDVPVGWPPGATNSFVVFGWSVNAGYSWPQVAAELSGAVLDNGLWTGPGLVSLGGGFLGMSGASYGAAGGFDPNTGQTLPSFPLFGPAPNPNGVPLAAGFDLFVVMPEPTVFALMIPGLLALWWRRRIYCARTR